jgi:hypothetical protein
MVSIYAERYKYKETSITTRQPTMSIAGSAYLQLPGDAARSGSSRVDGRVGLPQGDASTLCLSDAVAEMVKHRVSHHLCHDICEQVKGIWNYEVTVYRNAHPDFQSPPVPGRNGMLQRVLPVQYALLLAPRLVAIGLHRVHQAGAAAAQTWVDLGLDGDIASAIEGEINEEDDEDAW